MLRGAYLALNPRGHLEAQGTLKGPATMLQYLLPESHWDIVSIDLLQLLQSQFGSRYLLICITHFTRYVVLAPLKDKTATQVAHA